MHSKTNRITAFTVAFVACSAAAILTINVAAASQCGMASWYSLSSGPQTASGERLSDGALTAAHRTLPFGTRVKVENMDNGRSVVVRINDRGPFVNGRVIDLTRAAAQQIDMIGSGTADVRLTVLSGGADLKGCS